MTLVKKNLGWVVFFAALALFPLVVTNPFYTSIGVYSLLFMAAATSWNMFSGYSGYIALGSAVFFGVGAYTEALLSIHWHVPANGDLFWLVPLGGVIATLFAVPIGWISLRVRRHTFVVITIAVFFIFQLSAINFSFTGGSSGLALPFITWTATDFNNPFYYAGLILVIFITLVSAFVRRSRFGLQLLAIRDDEDRAMGLGVKVTAIKITGFTMSAFAIGCAGAIYAMFQGQIYPQFVFDPTFDVSVALMVFLGGIGTLAGPLLGGLVLESAQQYLTATYSNNSLYLLLFGALFLIVIMFMPQGVVPFVRDKFTKRGELERAAVAANDVSSPSGMTSGTPTEVTA
ncbi:MAG: branched-chain amino acid ABC transporter permease [Acidobacteria bacterium]|nr:branched-chain amino acid ABC transporter permease [Acidobacteriota bacterium]